MSIEIRELIIKVKIAEPERIMQNEIDIVAIKQLLLKECKREIKKQLSKIKER
ncbi:MAG: DUF5908 family protein [Cellulophaga sp.]